MYLFLFDLYLFWLDVYVGFSDMFMRGILWVLYKESCVSFMVCFLVFLGRNYCFLWVFLFCFYVAFGRHLGWACMATLWYMNGESICLFKCLNTLWLMLACV